MTTHTPKVTMPQNKNAKLLSRACRVIPSGVNSPVRAFQSVGGTPIFVRRAKGPFFWDENGKRYLDFCASWGPMIFGHAPAGLVQALRRAAAFGTSYGTATAGEVEAAERIRVFYPSMEKVRLVSSGTEAVMSAIRLARGFTGRSKIIKIDGGYHGHADSLLVKAGSGLATFGIPGSAGIPKELAKLTITIPFNQPHILGQLLKKEGKNVAAFILEPIPANMGVVPPEPHYLAEARRLTAKHGVLLIFDEVITGFRVAAGGVQGAAGIKPDLTCLGKILGGGMPLAAFGGRADIMDRLAPGGPVYQAGTLSGNPLAVAASLWTLRQLGKKGLYKKLEGRTRRLTEGIMRHASRRDYPVTLNRAASMFTLFFQPGMAADYDSVKKSDARRYARFFHACLAEGVYLAPSQFEANFVSLAHTDAHLKTALRVFCRALDKAFS